MIVVGNGPVHFPQGEIIDSFDTVVRLSHFETVGFEHLVGTKTDIWVVSNLWEDRDHNCQVWTGHPHGIYGETIDDVISCYGDGVRCASPELIKRIYTELKYYPYGNDKFHPTLGIIGLFLSMVYAQSPITITGFSFCDPIYPYSYLSREFKNMPSVLPGEHDFGRERALIGNYIKAGLIQPLLHPELKQ